MAMNMLNNNKHDGVKDTPLSAPKQSYHPNLSRKRPLKIKKSRSLGSKVYQRYYKDYRLLRTSKITGAKIDAIEEAQNYKNQAETVNALVNNYLKQVSTSKYNLIRSLFKIKLRNFK